VGASSRHFSAQNFVHDSRKLEGLGNGELAMDRGPCKNAAALKIDRKKSLSGCNQSNGKF